MTRVDTLVEAIHSLPPARQAEVEQFVAFVALRERIAASVAAGGAYEDGELARDLDLYADGRIEIITVSHGSRDVIRWIARDG